VPTLSKEIIKLGLEVEIKEKKIVGILNEKPTNQ